MAHVTLDRINRIYPGGTHAVRDVSLEVADGEFMVLVGPSGCGKSTTLRMVAGLEPIDRGALYIGAREVSGAEPAERDIAMVFQNYALYPHMTCAENMAFGLRVRGMARAERERRVREAAELLAITDLLDRKPAKMSGGQRQRVAIGRAIVRQPAVFLFDEPLSNLDAKLRGEMRAELAGLHRRLGATMLYVTHDQVEAMTLGDRICVLRDGEVQQVGTPIELYEQPANAFVARFIGSPPMNVWELTAPARAAAQSTVRVNEVELAYEQPGAPVDEIRYIGLRPEHLYLDHRGTSAFTASVTLVERLGGETLVHARAGGSAITIRAAGNLTLTEGADVRVGYDPARTHVFAR